jgi:hypothetical protein
MSSLAAVMTADSLKIHGSARATVAVLAMRDATVRAQNGFPVGPSEEDAPVVRDRFDRDGPG